MHNRRRKNRVTVAHGVGVYSLNPYAVNTSPLQAVWGSVMEPLIDADYDKRGYQGVLAESWQMKGTRLQFKLRKGVRFHDGTPFSFKDVVASLNESSPTNRAYRHRTWRTSKRWTLPMTLPSS